MVTRRNFVKGLFLLGGAMAVGKQDYILEGLNKMNIIDLESKYLGKKETLEDKYGINIEVDNLSFPESWNNFSVNYESFNTINPKIQVLDSLEKDLSKYPPNFIQKNIDAVQIPKKLVINEIEYAGAHSL